MTQTATLHKKATGSPIVLVAWDGSPAAARAFPVARAIAEQVHGAVEVLHVCPSSSTEADVRKHLGRQGLDVEHLDLRMEVGDPASGILAAVHDPAVNLVVLATHGRVIEQGRPMGHVAEEIARRTSRPVLLVRPEAVCVHRPLRRLMLPLDGTPSTTRALAPAIALAQRLGAALDVVHVIAPGGRGEAAEVGSMRPPRYADQPHHEWPQWEREFLDRVHACLGDAEGVPSHVYCARGPVADEITRYARKLSADAIVLVRRSRMESGRARTLRAVLDDAPCPVLLLGAAA